MLVESIQRTKSTKKDSTALFGDVWAKVDDHISAAGPVEICRHLEEITGKP